CCSRWESRRRAWRGSTGRSADAGPETPKPRGRVPPPSTGLVALRPRSTSTPALVHRLLELLAGLEADALAGLDLDRLACRGVAALAGGALGDREAAEPGDLGGVAALEGRGDRAEDRVEGV